MYRSIVSYCKNYLQNFREHPGKATVALALQIVFLIGWVFFFALFCQFCGEAVGGYFTDGEQYHGNFYLKAAVRLAYGLVLIWLFIDLAEMFFAATGGLKQKAKVIGLSLLAAAFVAAVELSLLFWQERFAPASYHPYAFWHPRAAELNADPWRKARQNYHACGTVDLASVKEVSDHGK